MAIKSSSAKAKLFNEINITPLTDIFLVLLIIMMVMAPMFQSIDKNIALPKINSGLSSDENKVSVAITKDAKFYVNTAAIKPDELQKKLESLLSSSKDKKITIKADSMTKSKEIIKVMNAAQSAGYEKLVVAGDPLSMQQQKDLEDKSKKG